MKTLVIHPQDVTTDFLNVIYKDKPWTVITDPRVSKSILKAAIKHHDRIIMLGHGNEYGLFARGRFIIDSDWVYLLREKEIVAIWCNADQFVNQYELKGFYTGMIISEQEEAYMYSVPYSGMQMRESNELFASSIAEAIDKPKEQLLEQVKAKYTTEDNNVIFFNKQNLYLS